MSEPDPIDAGSAAPFEIPASARRLLRVVYIMGIILVLLVITLVGAIIWKSTRKAEPVPPPQAATLSLGLPQGSDILATAIDGDRLVITTAREVVVIDIRKNAILSRITTGP